MEVIYLDLNDIPALDKSACCIGFFDGFHVGHQALVKKAIEIANEKQIAAGLITFDPDPWVLFKPEANLDHITSVEDRIEIAKRLGIEKFYVLHFTKEFAALSPEEFHQLLKSMQVNDLVCGFDYHYGCKNQGNIDTLRQQDFFSVHVIDSVNFEGKKISSSRIEPLIRNGQMEEANQMLNTWYSIEGVIVQGYRRGSQLMNIPTANLEMSESYVLPGVGVYSGYMLYEGRMYEAMINVGKNPTFQNKKLTIEAHILDFSKNIYDANVRFFFVTKIREEARFDSFLELKEQLKKDIQTTHKVLQNCKTFPTYF